MARPVLGSSTETTAFALDPLALADLVTNLSTAHSFASETNHLAAVEGSVSDLSTVDATHSRRRLRTPCRHVPKLIAIEALDKRVRAIVVATEGLELGIKHVPWLRYFGYKAGICFEVGLDFYGIGLFDILLARCWARLEFHFIETGD